MKWLLLVFFWTDVEKKSSKANSLVCYRNYSLNKKHNTLFFSKVNEVEVFQNSWIVCFKTFLDFQILILILIFKHFWSWCGSLNPLNNLFTNALNTPSINLLNNPWNNVLNNTLKNPLNSPLISPLNNPLNSLLNKPLIIHLNNTLNNP